MSTMAPETHRTSLGVSISGSAKTSSEAGSAVEEEERLRDHVARLAREADQLAEELKTVEAERNAATAQVDSLLSDLEKASGRIVDLEGDLSRLAQPTQAEAGQVDVAAALETERKALREALQRATALEANLSREREQRTKLEADLAAEKARTIQLENSQSEMQRRLSALEAELSLETVRARDAKAALEVERRRAADLEARSAKNPDPSANLEEALRGARTDATPAESEREIAQLEAEFAAEKQRASQLEATQSDASLRLAALESELSLESFRARDAKAALDLEQKRAADLEQQLAEVSEQVKALRVATAGAAPSSAAAPSENDGIELALARGRVVKLERELAKVTAEAAQREAPPGERPASETPRRGTSKGLRPAMIGSALIGLVVVAAVPAWVVQRAQANDARFADHLALADARLAAGRLLGAGDDEALDHLIAAAKLKPGDERVGARLAALAAACEDLGDQALQHGDKAEAAAKYQASLLAATRPSAAAKLKKVEDDVRRAAKEGGRGH